MSINPSAIANYFLQKGEDEGIDITQLKLIKLVYLAHGWSLWGLDEPLFPKNSFEAWQHGPVFPSLYHEFKHYGNSPIDEKATEIEMVGEVDLEKDQLPEFKLSIPKVDESEDKSIISLLDFVWGTYKDFSGWGLRELTHQEGTPWKEIYDEKERNKKIPDALIKKHFEEKAKQYGLEG